MHFKSISFPTVKQDRVVDVFSNERQEPDFYISLFFMDSDDKGHFY